jgi:minichromosome maintenance protein 10
LDKGVKEYTKPAASNLLTKLATISNRASTSDDAAAGARRSAAFSEAASLPPVVSANARDDRLALIEELPIGPIEHNPPPGDPTFNTLEPYSGIRLSCVSPSINARDIDIDLRQQP